MIKNILTSLYGINVEEETRIDQYEACVTEGKLYTLIPVSQIEDDTINELEQIASHIYQTGDYTVSTFLEAKEGGILTELEDQRFCVLANERLKVFHSRQLGKKLGKFHYRGRAVPFGVQKISLMGQWKGLWEQRIDQMESYWNGMLYKQPESDFDRLFLESFPYYMGMAENAIQYLVDTELDDEPNAVDSGTICYNRFTKNTWAKDYYIKNPFDWIFDHCGRDLAEWTRERYFKNIKTYHREVKVFFDDYQSITPLSSFSWRLIYSRLLFPIHYVECVENYYSATNEADRLFHEDRLKKMLNQSADLEEFLNQFYNSAEVPVKKLKIPTVSWL
ncbi:spore coat putative kinase YutH [Bacillus sp. B1-b2]|uniref:spore coat putative kinase YutH n=1 Tax=Bacillus sp. B1-b2 TaxID=2653201 RepID=UPI001261692E|nr:spore coat protein YutH [Bacillus sp. B1-b2]KAB7666486.1 spore coat protein YutH [Bacillus sp. B1-b2]